MKNVLIAYSTYSGSTEEIVDEITVVLEKSNICVVLLNLTDLKGNISLDIFDGLIIGSSIRMGTWSEEALRFLNDYLDQINHKKTVGSDFIFGSFITSGEAAKMEKRDEIREKYLLPVMRAKNLNPEITAVFGGVVDFTNMNSLNVAEGKALNKLKVKIGEDFLLDDQSIYDFRDWVYIRKFAEDLTKMLIQ